MRLLFQSGISAFIRDDALFVRHGNSEKKISSRRSAEREYKILSGLKSPGKIILYLAPFAPWQQLPDGVVWLNPFGILAPARENLLQSPEEWQSFLFSLSGEEKFLLEIHPGLPEREKLSNLLQHDLQMAAARLKTLRHFRVLWPWNFRHNLEAWLKAADWRKCRLPPPDAIVLGGPQADTFLEKMSRHSRLWCADTAWPALVQRGFQPDLVASIDAGYASLEHFTGIQIPHPPEHPPLLLLDALSVPALYHRPGWKIITYRSSHPLVQQTPSQHGELYNATGDVRGILEALHHALFPQKELCPVLGGDGCHLRGMSHLRGSAYQRRYLTLTNRFARFEEYSRQLSLRYRRPKDR